MIVDGKQIAEEIYASIRVRVEELGRAPVFSIIVCAPNFETQKYLALKQKKAEALGIDVRIYELDATCETKDFLEAISNAVGDTDGVIVQLPLPTHIDRDQVLAHIPTTHDADALNPQTVTPLSPVVGAIQTILKTYNIEVEKKQVTIIGSGRLVGLPAFRWFTEQGAYVSLVTKDTLDIGTYTKSADIIVCGAGVPGLLKPSMIQEGVIILDAGTSEDGGELKGDADPLCSLKASLLTPVPGGIGPVTIAVLLANVVDCAVQRKSML
jgi:methylenetetrahydrofolate dehydrogenase (NADP+)/methenyltetrahydrofolate cyclohydrolase